MPPPYPAYEERHSDSPLIHHFGWGVTDGEGTAPLHADSRWYMLFQHRAGQMQIALGGPITKTWFLPYTADGEWFGIHFSTGTFMPHLSAAHLVNKLIALPQASRRHFWL